jgi:molybdate transport system substrate-binding protein
LARDVDGNDGNTDDDYDQDSRRLLHLNTLQHKVIGCEGVARCYYTRAKRVQAGEVVDIVVLASSVIDKLIAEEKLLKASRVDLVKSGIGVAVRQGAARYDISSEDAVRNAVLAARSLSYSTGPSGTYLQQLFERWGIFQTVQSRMVVPPPGIPVGSLVAKGECELGFQQMSELINLAGIEVLGSLPPSIQSITVFSAGIARTCMSPDAARRVLDHMASPHVGDLKRRFGMEPA